MKIGDTVYLVTGNQVKEVEVFKVTRDFVTVKYKTYQGYGYYGQDVVGAIRVRKSRLFYTEEIAKQYIKNKKYI